MHTLVSLSGSINSVTALDSVTTGSILAGRVDGFFKARQKPRVQLPLSDEK